MNRRRLMISVTAACLILAGLIAYLGTTGRPGPAADAGHIAGTPITSTSISGQATAPPAAGSATLTSPSTAASRSTAATSAATPAKQSSATATPRTASAATALAGRIRPKAVYQGVATAYVAGDGGGACLYDPSNDHMIAAMNVTDYESSKACGAYILIHAANGASITVRIVNECPYPCAPGQIDLSHEAFAKLADLKVGRLPITWSLVSPSTADTISIRYKAGSSQWWCAIQVIGHRNPVALLEIRAGGGWRQLPRAEYNYFISADGSGCGGAIRVTDIYGQQLVINGIALSPDVVQRTTAQFAQH